MKISLLLLPLVLLLSLSAFSQKWTKVITDGIISKPSSAAIAADSMLILANAENINSCGHESVYAYNTEGQLKWKKLDKRAELVLTNSNFIYVCGTSRQDDAMCSGILEIKKLDFNGNTINTYSTSDNASLDKCSLWNFYPSYMYFFGNEIVVGSKDIQYIFDLNLNFVKARTPEILTNLPNNNPETLATKTTRFKISTFRGQTVISATPLLPDHLPGNPFPNLQLEEVNVKSIEELGDFFKSYNVTYQFIVKNNGNQVINSFHIYALLNSGINCQRDQFYSLIDSITIDPGESKILESTIKSRNTEPICFEVLAPNGLPDSDTTNNLFCSTYILSTKEISNSFDLEFYPNPVSDYIKVSGNNSLNLQYDIINANGKTVIQGTTTQTINTSELSPGFYLLKISDKTGHKTKIFIKN